MSAEIESQGLEGDVEEGEYTPSRAALYEAYKAWRYHNHGIWTALYDATVRPDGSTFGPMSEFERGLQKIVDEEIERRAG